MFEIPFELNEAASSQKTRESFGLENKGLNISFVQYVTPYVQVSDTCI